MSKRIPDIFHSFNSITGNEYGNPKTENADLRSWHPQYPKRCYFFDKENVKNSNTKTIKKNLKFALKQINESYPKKPYFLNHHNVTLYLLGLVITFYSEYT